MCKPFINKPEFSRSLTIITSTSSFGVINVVFGSFKSKGRLKPIIFL